MTDTIETVGDTQTPSVPQEIRDLIDELVTAVSGADFAASDILSKAVNVAAGTTTEIIPEDNDGSQMYILGWVLTASVASGTYQFRDDTENKTGLMAAGINGGSAVMGDSPVFRCGTNEALILETVGCAIDGIITYVKVFISS